MILHCDNMAATHIDSDFVYHKHRKHIEVSCQFINEMMKGIQLELLDLKLKLLIF